MHELKRDALEQYVAHWTPGGSQTRSKSLAAYGLAGQIGQASHGIGSRVWTTDKVPYIDWVCGLGAMTLGYGRREIEEAAGHQLVRGASYSIPHWLEGNVAEQLCSVVPGAEQCRWLKTGSEACEAAVRIARKATGHTLILTPASGYHGWHSWFQASKPEHPGVPECYGEAINTFTYNDLRSLDYAEASWPGKVAAVLLEPTLFEHPKPGFLEWLRAWCDKRGALLIFDECVLGFRLKRAGGTEHFQVRPDLAVFGKALASGFPLASVCGPRELMQHADVVSGTFGGEAISLAVAGAVLDIYETEDVCERITKVGNTVTTLLLDMAKFGNLHIAFDGWACVGRLRFLQTDHEDEALALFTQTMAAHGVLWHPRIVYPSAAHTIEDIEKTGEAALAAFTAIKRAMETNDWSAVDQVPVQPFARRVNP